MAEVTLYNEAECEKLIRDVEASPPIRDGGRLPDCWEKLTKSQRRVYAVRMSTNPPLSMRETARALGQKPSSIDTRWTEIRRITNLPDVAKIDVRQLPEPTIDLDEVTPGQITKLARRRIFEVLQGMDRATVGEMSGRDKAQAAKALTDMCETWMQRPEKLREMKDRKHAAELAVALAAALQKHGIAPDGSGKLRLEAESVPDAEFE